MSAGNLEAVKQGIEAFQRGDLGTWLAMMDEHVVWVPVRNHPEPTPRHGREAALQFAEEWVGPWDNYEFETKDLRELDDGVIWTAHFRANNEGSALAMDEQMTCIFFMSRGKVMKMEWFWSTDEALASLEDD